MTSEATTPRLILWDVDHTLIETRGIGGRLARAAFQEVTGVRLERMATATGKTEPVILAETLRAHGIQPTDEHQRQYAHALPEQYRHHIDQLRQIGRALPGAAEALAALHNVPGTIQTVLTGNYRQVAAVKVAAYHLSDALDLDVGAYADDHTDRAHLVPIAVATGNDTVDDLHTAGAETVLPDLTDTAAVLRAIDAATLTASPE